MVYPTNQNRNLFVAGAYVATPANVQDIAVGSVGEGKDKAVYFQYKGADTVLRSDLIPVENISYAKAISAKDMIKPLKSLKISLDTNVNGGNLVVGQDYLLRIELSQFFGPSSEDLYYKDAVVRATSAMNSNKKAFYDALADSLNRSFAREINSTKTSNPYLSFTGAVDGITITEKIQDSVPGIAQQERVIFNVFPTTIYVNGTDEIWGKVEDVTPSKANAVVGTTGIGNGAVFADLEWFCAGERGDIYRGINYPDIIPTKYFVDASKQYNAFEIHYAFTDTGVNSYRSEKDITVIFPAGNSGDDYTEINKFIGAFNTASGLSVGVLA